MGLVGESLCICNTIDRIPHGAFLGAHSLLSPAALCCVHAAWMLLVTQSRHSQHAKQIGWYHEQNINNAGINGAGKTTQLQIISGALEPDSGTVIKERPNMKIAYLTQEFDVQPTRTVRVSAHPLALQRQAYPLPSVCLPVSFWGHAPQGRSLLLSAGPPGQLLCNWLCRWAKDLLSVWLTELGPACCHFDRC